VASIEGPRSRFSFFSDHPPRLQSRARRIHRMVGVARAGNVGGKIQQAKGCSFWRA
jgi:hypothetical protein